MEEAARRRVEAYLQQVVGDRDAAPRTPEEVRYRADMAVEFIERPYWKLMCQMLTGTIRAETEDMLSSDERLALNRASVASCRRVLRMPFIDIEQGERTVNVASRFSSEIHLPKQDDLRIKELIRKPAQ